MRTVTSGRVMIVSTKFRSDLFYSDTAPKHDELLKLWALYANAEFAELNEKDIQKFTGRENSFAAYFQSINKLSHRWHYYRLYQKAFGDTYANDPKNPVTMVVLGCDQHLVVHPSIKRGSLLRDYFKDSSALSEDTFSLAMHILNNETHTN